MPHLPPLLGRMLFPVLGALLLCAIGYLGLGLLVWSQPKWVMWALGQLRLGNRYNATAAAYERAMAFCFPGDRDGDGVGDGMEIFRHSNPANARIHPALQFDLMITSVPAGFPRNLPMGTLIDLGRCVVVRAGERCQVRGRLNVSPFYPHMAPPGLRLRLTPAESTSLSLPGGALEAAPLLLPVSTDGSVTFDVSMPANPGSDKAATHDLTVDNAATGENIATLMLLRVWPLPTSEVKVQKIPEHRAPSGILAVVHHRLQWPSMPKSAEGVLIEAASQEHGTDWHLSEICPSKETGTVIWSASTLEDLGPGELQFRVTPIRYSPAR